MANFKSDALFEGLFVSGILADDLPAVHPLLRARPALQAFITLFRGSEDEVMARLLVLREIGARGDAPRWSPQALRQHFAYIETVRLETVLKRLREYNLLIWDNDASVYQISQAGRTALAAISTVLSFSHEQDAELGYITAQVAAGQAMGKVSGETLNHLLARLNELQIEFEQAVLAGSEWMIRAAQSRLDSVWQWVEKGTEIIQQISADEQLDSQTYRIAQAIGQAQSKMLRMAAMFQRALNTIEKQRVHLGHTGITSSDVMQWLRKQDAKDIQHLVSDIMVAHPHPLFVTAQEMVDIAEFELLARERQKYIQGILPPAQKAPETLAPETERLTAAADFLDDLQKVTAPQSLHHTVAAQDYPHTAYRLSLLSLLNDPESEALASVVAEITRLPLGLELSHTRIQLDHPHIAEITDGRIFPQARPLKPTSPKKRELA